MSLCSSLPATSEGVSDKWMIHGTEGPSVWVVSTGREEIAWFSLLWTTQRYACDVLWDLRQIARGLSYIISFRMPGYVGDCVQSQRGSLRCLNPSKNCHSKILAPFTRPPPPAPLRKPGRYTALWDSLMPRRGEHSHGHYNTLSWVEPAREIKTENVPKRGSWKSQAINGTLEQFVWLSPTTQTLTGLHFI